MADFFRWPFCRPTGQRCCARRPGSRGADAFEAEGALVVKADLPGVKKDDIAITVRDRG
jgi:HSP20 family molecular chaperone IbpA